MIRSTLAATLISLACYSPVLADECDATTDRVMQATGATFVRHSDSTQMLKHPLLGEHLTVYCGNPHDPSRTNVSIYWTGMSPPKAFYELSAKAGSAVTGDPPAMLIPVMMKCRAKALRDITADEPNGSVDGMPVGRSEVECDAFTHDDGGSDFTIGKRR